MEGSGGWIGLGLSEGTLWEGGVWKMKGDKVFEGLGVASESSRLCLCCCLFLCIFILFFFVIMKYILFNRKINKSVHSQ